MKGPPWCTVDFWIMINQKQLSWEVLQKSILSQRDSSHKNSVFYVGLYKESETGLLYNERMLVIQDRKFTIFYTKHFRPLPELLLMEKQGDYPIKERVPIQNCKAEWQQNILRLIFINEQGEQRRWVFKFVSAEVAQKWAGLMEEVQERCLARSNKSKETKSTGFASQFSSILNSLSLNSSILPPEQESEESRPRRVNVRKIQEQAP